MFLKSFKSGRRFTLPYFLAKATCVKLLSTLAIKRYEVATKKKTKEWADKQASTILTCIPRVLNFILFT